jgi:hypothetical protein
MVKAPGAFMLEKAMTAARTSLYLNSIHPDMFRDSISPDRAKWLFKKYVHDVELENHSYCNRVCWFCPNAFLDRRSASHFMSDAVFQKIIGNLAEIDYAEQLEWSGYAEHFAEPSFIPRLEEARKAVPKARLIVFSNGDYLDKELMDHVLAIGVKIHVDIYPPEGEEFNEVKIAAAIAKFEKRTGYKAVLKGGDASGWGDYLIADTSGAIVSSMKVGKYNQDNIFTRGGAMDIPKRHTYQRTSACLKPVYHLNVNYDGNGMLCCHTRTDYDGHKDAVIANLSEPSENMFTFFAKLASARRGLLGPGKKCGACATCDDGDGLPGGMLARTPAAAAPFNVIRRVQDMCR